MEPGNYDVTNQDMGNWRNSGSHFYGSNDGSTPVVSNNSSGQITTSQGTARSNIMIHPQGSYSHGCITTSDEFAKAVEDAVKENGGKLKLEIVDAGDCPCP